MFFKTVQQGIWNVKSALIALKEPTRCRPKVGNLVAIQDLLEQTEFQNRKSGGRLHEFLQPSDQCRSPESFDKSSLRSRHPEQPPSSLDLARSQFAVFSRLQWAGILKKPD